MAATASHGPARLLIVPGLNDSGAAHWQTWLQSLHRGAVRVEQRDWAKPELDRWAGRVASTIDRHGSGSWLVAAHSFGALATARALALQPDLPVAGVLLVAPADPDKWGLGELLPQGRLRIPSTMVVSETDPWLRLAKARHWAQRWGSQLVNLGDASHINAEAGFGPLPCAQRWFTTACQGLERARRPERASFLVRGVRPGRRAGCLARNPQDLKPRRVTRFAAI
jgi:predicted alpha/beta hydrolase family esterase